MPRQYTRIPTIDRFMQKIDRKSSPIGCWIWTGARFSNGYGVFGLFVAGHSHMKNVRAHRWAYENFIGPIADGLLVCHRCDNRACVNPEHLFLGTQKDNITDMMVKGRQPDRHPGEAHPFAKLTEDDVRAIRAWYAVGGISQQRLGEMFGISQTAVGLIVRRHNWKHVK